MLPHLSRSQTHGCYNANFPTEKQEWAKPVTANWLHQWINAFQKASQEQPCPKCLISSHQEIEKVQNWKEQEIIRRSLLHSPTWKIMYKAIINCGCEITQMAIIIRNSDNTAICGWHLSFPRDTQNI